jgi:acetyl-CoA synthetase
MDLSVEDLRTRGVSQPEAETIAAVFMAARGLPGAEVWRTLTTGVLSPSIPFAAHAFLWDVVFAGWDVARGPRPAWTPTDDEAARTNIAALMRKRGFGRFEDLHRWSVSDREAFWSDALALVDIPMRRRPGRVLDDAAGAEQARWLPGARLNIVEGCLRGASDAAAIVWHTPEGHAETVTYAQLAERVARVSARLVDAGFATGDAVAIDMPMNPRSVEIYLGLVAAGCIVVSIADSMAADEIATRLRIAGARGVFTAHRIERGGKSLPLYEKVVAAGAPRAIVLDAAGATLRPGDLTWEAFVGTGTAPPFVPFVSEPDATTNILFSSGTTGDPKAIPWTHLTPIKAAVDAALHLDIHPGDVVAWPTNLGWMMGPWLIYAALINRATIALFSDAPGVRAFGRFVEDARVTMLGLVPSIVKAWRADDRMIGFDWRRVRCFGSTGEASNPEDYLYLMMLAGYRPVIEYCGGTEIGGGYLTGTLVQPAAPATFSTAALGSDLVILDEAGRPTDKGEVFLVPPVLGYSTSLLNRDHHDVYFEGTPVVEGIPMRRHGDEIERLQAGYYRAHGRVDDTMNLGGIKVSSAEIERVLDLVDGVTRTAAIAVAPAGGGPSELVVYAVAPGQTVATLRPRLQAALRERLNPLFRVGDLVLVDTLPVTASNKIMRRELRARYVARS